MHRRGFRLRPVIGWCATTLCDGAVGRRRAWSAMPRSIAGAPVRNTMMPSGSSGLRRGIGGLCGWPRPSTQTAFWTFWRGRTGVWSVPTSQRILRRSQGAVSPSLSCRCPVLDRTEPDRVAWLGASGAVGAASSEPRSQRPKPLMVEPGLVKVPTSREMSPSSKVFPLSPLYWWT